MSDTQSNNIPSVRLTRIELHHLRFAIAAADCGSFRQAAELLSVQHSVLSRAISYLEHSIGSPLFARSSSGVSLTPAGQNVLQTARMILEQIDALFIAAKFNSRREGGYLSVGFLTSISAGNLRATLLDFKRRYPEVELAMLERSRTRLTTALRNGTLDVLIVTGEIPSLNGKIQPLWTERILVSLPKDHPLAARNVVYWTDLRNENVLLDQNEMGRELEALLMSKLVSSEERPRIERHNVSRSTIKNLVSMGFGISLVMESEIGATLTSVVYRELRDGAGPSRIDFSAYWRADNENPALGRFLKLLAERYPSPNSGE
ncbi:MULTISPECIES: LysR family transcriptional regulator [unclassified Bradyrhizobium]|uniref:LysR family transcriptional regulator n=1 Tax=unclassified Bradyrhizobium TaxID=2631580 RepID=UPI00247955C0|nr:MULTISPECIES: LysR family transcriptional regulator [unclassified Bradyrhizobium]WGR73791.1 LysR family transcriptional regulator [Bradyrhizobium sp. ISRA426]WGR78629.1 LysR family transcriptional regulator [Bradyrhizobium sp. ISRA430]WGR89030.1 LysR family transcriptional regulator [Bradyrhizobium sp. ISRA432]